MLYKSRDPPKKRRLWKFYIKKCGPIGKNCRDIYQWLYQLYLLVTWLWLIVIIYEHGISVWNEFMMDIVYSLFLFSRYLIPLVHFYNKNWHKIGEKKVQKKLSKNFLYFGLNTV